MNNDEEDEDAAREEKGFPESSAVKLEPCDDDEDDELEFAMLNNLGSRGAWPVKNAGLNALVNGLNASGVVAF